MIRTCVERVVNVCLFVCISGHVSPELLLHVTLYLCLNLCWCRECTPIQGITSLMLEMRGLRKSFVILALLVFIVIFGPLWHCFVLEAITAAKLGS